MLFRISVFLALAAFVHSEGYWDIQLSPQSVASVPFGPGHISVWQHANQNARYYAMPLVYLLNQNARTKSNILTRKHEMSFEVMMWSLEAKEAVYRHVKASTNSEVEMDGIELLPMEKIRIVWKDNIRPIASDFTLSEQWKSNTHLPAVVTFQFTCRNAEVCNELTDAMKTSPDIFNALELEYIINGQRAARRSLTVTGNQIRAGKLWTKMTTTAGSGSVRYLNADDLKTVVSESVTNVLASVTTDSDYVDTGDEVRLSDVLKNVLGRHEVESSSFNPQMWESVFWDPVWARPDKFTSYLNRVLTKDASDSRNFLLNENARSRSAEGSAGGSFLGIVSVSGSGGSSSSSQSKVQKEDVLKVLKERHSNIEWTGEVFRMKPMKLFRLNLSTLNTSNTIATANIQVRKYETVHSIKLRVTESAAGQVPSLTPQLVAARLSEKINQTKAELSRKLQSTQQSVNQRLNNLPLGWPAGGYCILAKGSCPPGFSRHEGHIRAISTYAANHNYIKSMTFGASSIRCHGNCGQYPNWYAELNLVTCCH